MTIQAFKLGSVGQDSVVGTKVCTGEPTTSNNYMTLESPLGTDYQVTAGYTFYITHINLYGAANVTAVFGYGDTGVTDTSGAPTNSLRLTGKFGAGVDNNFSYNVLIPIPAGKYPWVLSLSGAPAATVFGVEIAD